MITNITTNSELDKLVLENEIVLLDFWAQWCGPCKGLAPQLERLDGLMDIVIAKADIDEAMEVANAFAVMSVPTLVLYVNGEMKEKISGGGRNAEFLESWINSHK